MVRATTWGIIPLRSPSSKSSILDPDADNPTLYRHCLLSINVEIAATGPLCSVVAEISSCLDPSTEISGSRRV